MNDAPNSATVTASGCVVPKTIALIGKYSSRQIAGALCPLAQNLQERGIEVIVETDTANISELRSDLRHWENCSFTAIGERADLAIVLGGDGTMLNAARQLARYDVPLVGVNQGRLGFMTDIARDDMLTSIDDLLAGRFTPEKRMLLDAEIVRSGESVASNLALNEVVVDKAGVGRLIEFELFIDDEFVYSLRSDGLIASTPTGSTAYSLSAGGPILHTHMSCIALVPLCPHSLTNRPILVSDESWIEVRIVHASDSRLYFDGQVTFDLRPHDSVRIRRSDFSICLLHPPGYSYFAMLREKLHWNKHTKAF